MTPSRHRYAALSLGPAARTAGPAHAVVAAIAAVAEARNEVVPPLLPPELRDRRFDRLLVVDDG